MQFHFNVLRAATNASLCTAALALSGCGGGGSGCPTPTPPVTTCIFPNGTVTPQMIYPEPNATGVPDNLQIFVLADINVGTYTSGNYILEFSLKKTIPGAANNTTWGDFWIFQQIPQSQVPQPSAAATLPNAIYIAATPGQSNASALQAHTTYYVYLDGGFVTDCNANGPIGSFTTT